MFDMYWVLVWVFIRSSYMYGLIVLGLLFGFVSLCLCFLVAKGFVLWSFIVFV